MRPRQPRQIPHEWLMTDPRLGPALWDILEHMPQGSGIVFRDYALPRAERVARFARIRRIARRRGLVLIRAGRAAMRGEDGVHGNDRLRRPGIRTMSVHSRREAVAALRAGADAVFVSPVHPTRSHARARALGRVRTGLIVRDIRVPVVALGGMDPIRLGSLRSLRIKRYAAIDAWLQKRKAVPI